MSKVSLRLYNPAKVIDKNVLYRINDDTNIECVEEHGFKAMLYVYPIPSTVNSLSSCPSDIRISSTWGAVTS